MKKRAVHLFTLSLILIVFPTVTSTAQPLPTCRGKTATIVGTLDDDVLVGTAGRDIIVGLAGNDEIDGMGGNDLICGGAGDDLLIGRRGRDTLDGGNGRDVLIGGPGHDKLFGAGKADILSGNGGRDVLKGHDGRDSLRGGSGNDRLFGGPGNDTLRGQAGDDRLDGGAAADRCFGELELNCEVWVSGGRLNLLLGDQSWPADTAFHIAHGYGCEPDVDGDCSLALLDVVDFQLFVDGAEVSGERVVIASGGNWSLMLEVTDFPSGYAGKHTFRGIWTDLSGAVEIDETVTVTFT